MAGMCQHEQSHAVKGTSSSHSPDTSNDSWQRSKNRTRNDHDSKAKACKFCGTTHVARNCPAYGRNKYGMRNHFAQCCSNFVKTKQTQKTPVHTVKPDSNNHADGNMFVYTVLNSRNREWHAVLDINGRHLKVKIDTGASCIVMAKQAYDVLNAQQPTGIRLCKTKLESYGRHRLTVQGRASFTAEYKRKYYLVDFVILRGNAPIILGLQSSVELRLISRIDGVTSAGKLVDDYCDVFCGLHCLNREHHIQLRGDAKPVVHSA